MSDCGAILDMHRLTPYAATPEDAVAYAFNAGVYIPTFCFSKILPMVRVGQLVAQQCHVTGCGLISQGTRPQIVVYWICMLV